MISFHFHTADNRLCPFKKNKRKYNGLTYGLSLSQIIKLWWSVFALSRHCYQCCLDKASMLERDILPVSWSDGDWTVVMWGWRSRKTTKTTEWQGKTGLWLSKIISAEDDPAWLHICWLLPTFFCCSILASLATTLRRQSIVHVTWDV